MYSTRSLSLMITIVVASTLPCAAQSSSPGQAGQPQGGTPPTTFPTESHPSSTMPPDTAAPPPTESSNFKIAGQIRTAITQEDRLNGSKVLIGVTDDRVTVAGHVSDNDNRYLALRIASEFAGARALVDKLRMGDEQ